MISSSPHQESSQYYKISAMFSQKQKQNAENIQNGFCYKQTQLLFSRQRSRQEKEKKMANLRQVYTSSILNWNQPLSAFLQTLEGHNHYSLLLTLFEIAEDPLWRNRVPHICVLIQRLHNSCVDKKGEYLPEIRQISNYHQKLCRIFYLNDTNVQQHFKLLVMAYLSYNIQVNFLSEPDIALGLVHAGRHRSDNRFPEYMWIICQIRVDYRAIVKILKYSSQMLSSNSFSQQIYQVLYQTLIPMMTTISNYLCYEHDPFVLDQLIDNQSFQNLLMRSLSQNYNPHLSKEALLLCNNLLAKSQALAAKLLCSVPLMQAASLFECEQQPIFQMLVEMRRGSMGLGS